MEIQKQSCENESVNLLLNAFVEELREMYKDIYFSGNDDAGDVVDCKASINKDCTALYYKVILARSYKNEDCIIGNFLVIKKSINAINEKLLSGDEQVIWAGHTLEGVELENRPISEAFAAYESISLD